MDTVPEDAKRRAFRQALSRSTPAAEAALLTCCTLTHRSAVSLSVRERSWPRDDDSGVRSWCMRPQL